MSDVEKMNNLIDALCDDILEMSDEDIMAEFIEDGGDPAELQAWIDKKLVFIKAVLQRALAARP